MIKHTTRLLTIGAAAAMASSASANIIFSDSFNYTDGDIVAVSGGTYVYSDSVNMPFANSTSDVASNELSLVGASSGSELNDINLASDFDDVDTIYAGMTLNMSDLDGNNYRRLFEFLRTNAFSRFELEIGGAGNSDWGIQISSQGSTGVSSTGLATPVTFGLDTDIRVVVSFSNTNAYSVIQAWAGTPGSLVEASPLLTEATTVSDTMLNFNLQTPRRMAGTVDDLIIGTTFSDVVAVPIPEPSAYAALLGVLALAFVTWRRRR